MARLFQLLSSRCCLVAVEAVDAIKQTQIVSNNITHQLYALREVLPNTSRTRCHHDCIMRHLTSSGGGCSSSGFVFNVGRRDAEYRVFYSTCVFVQRHHECHAKKMIDKLIFVSVVMCECNSSPHLKVRCVDSGRIYCGHTFYDYEVETSRFILECYVKLKVIKNVKVAASVLLWWRVYMCRWRRTLDFDFWDLGRVSHLEDRCENNGSQLVGAFKASGSYLRVWYRCEQHFRNSKKLWVHPDVNTATQSVTDHHVSLIQPDWIFAQGCTDCVCAHIYMRLDLKTNLKAFVGVEAVNPHEIHPHTEGTNTCTSRSVSPVWHVCFLLHVRWTSCQSDVAHLSQLSLSRPARMNTYK